MYSYLYVFYLWSTLWHATWIKSLLLLHFFSSSSSSSSGPTCTAHDWLADHKRSWEVMKLTMHVHTDIDLRLSEHIRDVVNLTAVDSTVWWLHVAYCHRGVFGRAWRGGRLDPALIRFGNDVLSWLIVIDLRENSDKTEQLTQNRRLVPCIDNFRPRKKSYWHMIGLFGTVWCSNQLNLCFNISWLKWQWCSSYTNIQIQRSGIFFSLSYSFSCT